MRQLELNSLTHPAASVARFAAATVAAVLLVALAAPACAQGAKPAATALKKECVACHDDPKVKAKDGKAMAPVGDDFARSAHRKLDCGDCHDAALGVKHPPEALGAVKPQVCQECHADEIKAIAGSIHGRRSKGDKAIKDCMGCHDSLHKVRKEGDPASTLSAINQIKTCGACHEEMMANYERSEHARALLKAGLVGSSPSCSSCHGKHDIHPKTEAGSTTGHAKIPETCGKCHSTILRDWEESAHGALWKTANGGRKSSEAPVCSTCHEPHAIKRLDSAVVRDQVADRCGACHTKVDKSFHDSFHGKASKLKNLKAAVCADCHTPHANLPASNPKSSIHPANLAKTCGASGCHQNVNAAFLTFDPHADPTDPNRNFYVYLVWIGMTGLLLGVFGFFGLHDLLWLQRAVVGRLRGEWSTHHKGGQYVRRFKSHQIWLHVSIVTSFLLLAATGLPLKYAEASWAPTLMAVFGNPEVAGLLHRFAAIVTFGYFAWHLGMLAYGWLVKGERGYFWGPRSMVPQPRDLLDLWAMVKFFLYIGPRPKFDRFTYWEKFDYMGVFWGVAVIGISGLVLWMPTFFTTFFPGWVLNAAYVVHSDEALLATGFIFLFHFFHTHLRPEAFPLDPVVFTGRMPLEAFKEERPLEYARLVAEGKLEERLVPAPTVVEMRVAYVFGFAALAIGIVLAVFIFRALLGGLMH
jgi:cytochrome b subunit of formate dehydrogenase